jgi:hypothetical protein
MFLDAELISDLSAIPLPALGLVVLFGLGLWICGWWWHRFWITVLTSFLAGLVGLHWGPKLGVTQPVVAGLLLALAGGALALSLARVAIFAVYGLAAWQIVLHFAASYAVPLICFTGGGLVSVLFFRFSVMFLTSAAGTVLLAYGSLAFLETMTKWRLLVDLAEYELLVHLCLAGWVLLGVLIQSRIWKAQIRWAQRKLEEALWQQRLNQMKEQEGLRPSGVFGIFRKAG